MMTPSLPRRPPPQSDYLQPSPRPQKKKKSRTGCWKAVVVVMSFLCLGATALSTYCVIKLFSLGNNGTNGARSHVTETQLSDRKRLDKLEEMIEQLITFNNVSGPTESNSDNNNEMSEVVKLQVVMQAHDREISQLQALLPMVNTSVFQNRDNFNAGLKTVERRIASLESAVVNASASLMRKIADNARENRKLREDLGWIPLFNGYEYIVVRSGLNFSQSRALCKSKGGDLASVGMRSNETRKYLTETLIPIKTPYSVWIGLTDLGHEGVWLWVDGVQATTSNTAFVSGEPNNFQGRQHCAYVHRFAKGYGMADNHCESRFSALCERRTP